jgi:hypothetical protein
MHWDGSRWTSIAGDPAVSRFPSARLEAVSAASATTCGPSAGRRLDGTVSEPLVQHWNGVAGARDGTQPGSAGRRASARRLHDVVARGPRDVVAVGNAGTAPFAIRWDGRRWTAIAVPVRDVSGALRR